MIRFFMDVNLLTWRQHTNLVFISEGVATLKPTDSLWPKVIFI